MNTAANSVSGRQALCTRPDAQGKMGKAQMRKAQMRKAQMRKAQMIGIYLDEGPTISGDWRGGLPALNVAGRIGGIGGIGCRRGPDHNAGGASMARAWRRPPPRS